MKFHTFEVIGQGKFPFPIDMLRYDSCYPVDGINNIGASIEGYKLTKDIPLKVKLVHIDADRYWRPTEARWASFNWTVVKDSHQIK